MNLSQRQEASAGLFFIVPAFVIILVFHIFPMFYAFDLSLFRWDMITKKVFVGLRNYMNLMTEPGFWKSLGVTFYYVLVSVPFDLGISLLFAVLLNRGLKGIGLFRTAFFLPYITSITAVAMVWLWIYNPKSYGLLNTVLGWFHIQPQKWLQSPSLAMPAMIVLLIWKNLGFNVIIFMTRLQNINKSYYEAAEMDGATKGQQFRFITFPLLGPTTLFLLTMSIIYAFQIFPSIYIMTPDGGPKDATTTVVFYLYKNAYEQFNMGYASAVAYVTFFIILAITLLQRRLTKGVAE